MYMYSVQFVHNCTMFRECFMYCMCTSIEVLHCFSLFAHFNYFHSCRPDLKVILMSATLNAQLFSQYFGE